MDSVGLQLRHCAAGRRMTEGSLLLALVLIFLTPLAAAGLALINAGLGRSRSAAHTMLASLCVMGVAALAYLICGFAWQSFSGGPSHAFIVDGNQWSWLGDGPLFLRGMQWDNSTAALVLLLGMFSAGLSAMIPLGTGSDRWRLSASLISTAVFAGFTYPLFAHWAWGGGWLQQLGVNCGLSHGFLDTGGAGVIHASGGLTALAMAWILGPRRGKYVDGVPAAVPGHDGIVVLFGCLVAFTGWLGLNGAGAMLFNGATPGSVVRVAVNTILAAGSACLATAAMTRVRYGRPDASLCANGWVGGLVASSAIAALVNPMAAALIGAITGAIVAISVEQLDLRLAIDDPGGAISVHGVAAIWGLLAAGIFGSGDWLAQTAGVATLLGFVFPVTYGLNCAINRFHPQRVAPDGDRQGMDLHELGAGAYPEFVTHHEDFTR
jgi:Amt family ammonium transporter